MIATNYISDETINEVALEMLAFLKTKKSEIIRKNSLFLYNKFILVNNICGRITMDKNHEFINNLYQDSSMALDSLTMLINKLKLNRTWQNHSKLGVTIELQFLPK